MADAEAESSNLNYAGCLLIVVPIIGLLVAGGLWLGQRKDAAKTPCQRYADVVGRILYNCHSGQDKSPERHMAVCEEYLDPTPACLERLEALTCDELQVPPHVAASAACSRK